MADVEHRLQDLSGMQLNSKIEQAREEVVVARNLYKRYKNFEAVKGINFTVYQQECFGILGPNGAGKSTTIRMLHCFSPISGGSLTVLGNSVVTQPRKIKAQLGVVSQDDNLDPDLSVIQNLLVYARYFEISKSEALRRAEEVLALFQLTEKRNNQIDELSGGMKRRLVIARSLINQPRLIILDEPTTGLDPAARQLVWQKLRYLRDSGTTLILTTHYMEEAAQLCDRLVIMNLGQILAEGTPAELVRQLVGYEVIELRAGSLNVTGLPALIGARPIRYEEAGDTLYLFGHAPDAFENWQLPETGYKLQRRASLEDVFLLLTGRGLEEGE
ncbi:MAG TPA: ABC transporter ATP-binding protein [Chloroflexia bacterium]|nr:ABC transporter ATP-binding protein [Chloroflexia bacterium]